MSAGQYTYYMEQTGCIVGSGATPSAREVVPPEGCAMYFGEQLSNKEFFFAGGRPVAYSADERAQLSQRPTHAAQWDIPTRQWVDLRDLAQLRSDKWAEIKQAREAALAAPLVTPFGVFDADEKGSASIIKSVLLANNLAALGYPIAIDFTLADNTQVVLDAAAMAQVGLLLAGREQTIRSHATALRGQIDAASLEALETIVWTYA